MHKQVLNKRWLESRTDSAKKDTDMSHFLNNAYKSAFAVHGFLERKSRGSGFLRRNPKSNERSGFLDAPDSRLPGSHLSKSILSPSWNSINAERRLTNLRLDSCAHCSNVRRPVAKLFELKSRIGSPPRKLLSEVPSVPPRLSCLRPLRVSSNIGRPDFIPNSRSATTCRTAPQNPFSPPRNISQFASRRVCQPIREGQRQSARACVDTDFRHKRDHLLPHPPHHFLRMLLGFLNPQAVFPVMITT
jgi:hypothetical protein